MVLDDVLLLFLLLVDIVGDDGKDDELAVGFEDRGISLVSQSLSTKSEDFLDELPLALIENFIGMRDGEAEAAVAAVVEVVMVVGDDEFATVVAAAAASTDDDDDGDGVEFDGLLDDMVLSIETREKIFESININRTKNTVTRKKKTESILTPVFK